MYSWTMLIQSLVIFSYLGVLLSIYTSLRIFGLNHLF
jgi:hypothetical protein